MPANGGGGAWSNAAVRSRRAAPSALAARCGGGGGGGGGGDAFVEGAGEVAEAVEGLAIGDRGRTLENCDIPGDVGGEGAPPPADGFKEARVAEVVLRNLVQSCYESSTPLQRSVNWDLMACAQAGSGKTAAFVSGLVGAAPAESEYGRREKESFDRAVKPRAFILVLALVPTKELVTEVPGSAMRDSFLVNGVAFKKMFSCAEFEQQPKKFMNPKILLFNIEFEPKPEKANAELRLSDPLQYHSIVDAVWNIIYDKLDKCVNSGAKIVLSRLAIGDLAIQHSADRGIFYASHVRKEELQRVAAATGGNIQTSVNNVIGEVLGSCKVFEEMQVRNEWFNIFSGCASHTATAVLRGHADQFIEEAEKSLHDAIMIVRRALKNLTVVPGGGAIDMEVSKYLRQHARTIAGKSQFFVNSFAKALEVIPRQLCGNAGFDATDVLNKLRQKHASGEGAN